MTIDSSSIRSDHPTDDSQPADLAARSERIDRLALAKAIDAGGRFKALTHHQLFPLIHGRLVAGQSPERIAYWLQGRLDPQDPLGRAMLSPQALANRLRRFRHRLPLAVFLPMSLIDALIHDAEADVDALVELQGLLLVQKNRIDRAYRVEVAMNLPLDQVGKEIERAVDLIMAIVKVQIELGTVEDRLTPAAMRLTQVNASASETMGMIQPMPRLHRYVYEHPEHIAVIRDALRAIPVEDESFEAKY